MDLTQLFNQLKSADIRLYLDNNQLRLSAPSGEFSKILKILVIDNKSNIINFLQEHESKELLPVNLPPNTILKEPTIKALAQVIQQAQHIQQLQAMKDSNTDNSTDEEEFIL